MLTHEQLMEEWQKDCKIDSTDLMTVMYAHPNLHSKYLTALMGYKVKLSKLTAKYQEARIIRVRYYNGEMTKEQLADKKWSQYLFAKPLKSQMEALVDAAPEIQEIEDRSIYIKTLVDACESIMKDINSRYFLFKTLVEYTKFQAGS